MTDAAGEPLEELMFSQFVGNAEPEVWAQLHGAEVWGEPSSMGVSCHPAPLVIDWLNDEKGRFRLYMLPATVSRWTKMILIRGACAFRWASRSATACTT